MSKRITLLSIFLVLIFASHSLQAAAYYKSSKDLIDTNNDARVGPEESAIYEKSKLEIFDVNRDGKIDAKELEMFNNVDKKILNGGESIDKLNEQEKGPYMKWREFLFSLAFKKDPSTAEKTIAKCYPDRDCSIDLATGMPVGGYHYGNPEAAARDISYNLIVFYAAGLNASMNTIIDEFEKTHPHIKVIAESSGSTLAIRKVTELKRQADIIFSADAAKIKNMLIPEYADWYIKFYRDRVVIAYTDESKYTNEINEKNWYKILTRKDVRYSYVNPDLAPIGYRTLLVLKLADLYYKEKIGSENISDAIKRFCLKENVVNDVAGMLQILEALSLDYGFVYESTAKQHNLKYIKLPDEIDLGSEKFKDFYKQAIVEVISKKTGEKETIIGAPVVFAFTILKETRSPAQAAEFLNFFLGQEGRGIMAKNDQVMLSPCPAYDYEGVPPVLSGFVSQEDFE